MYTQKKSIGRHSIQPWVSDSNSQSDKHLYLTPFLERKESGRRQRVSRSMNLSKYSSMQKKTIGAGNKKSPLTLYLKYLENCLIYSKCSISISYYCSFNLIHIQISRHLELFHIVYPFK